MKKFIAVVLLIAVLLSCCACGTDPAKQTEPSLDPSSMEAKYGHIDQTVLTDGVYKIWNAEGVKNMVKHPEGKFELLCTVDMQGATISPIGTAEKPFTGELYGANFFIQNFTVQGGSEESFGFLGVNQGLVRNLVLENVTFLPGANAKNIGTLLNTKGYFFVPFGQDDPVKKEASLVANMESIPAAVAAALQGKQLQPILV